MLVSRPGSGLYKAELLGQLDLQLMRMTQAQLNAELNILGVSAEQPGTEDTKGSRCCIGDSLHAVLCCAVLLCLLTKSLLTHDLMCNHRPSTTSFLDIVTLTFELCCRMSL